MIWPDMRDSVALFFSVGTQWRWVGVGLAGGFRTGLDYSVLPPVAAMIGATMDAVMLSDIRIMEAAALKVWSRKSRG